MKVGEVYCWTSHYVIEMYWTLWPALSRTQLLLLIVSGFYNYSIWSCQSRVLQPPCVPSSLHVRSGGGGERTWRRVPASSPRCCSSGGTLLWRSSSRKGLIPRDDTDGSFLPDGRCVTTFCEWSCEVSRLSLEPAAASPGWRYRHMFTFNPWQYIEIYIFHSRNMSFEPVSISSHVSLLCINAPVSPACSI